MHVKKMSPVSSNLPLALALAAGLLAGCAQVGPTDDPVQRHFTWHRYVGGEDIASACAPGRPDRYRLVYNAIYSEQRRAYDIAVTDDGGALQETRVMTPGNLLDVPLTDPLRPWRGETSLARMSSAEFADLRAILAKAGLAAGPKDGMFLRGDDFYWAASACVDGKFHFQAWTHDEPGFAALPLMQAVARFDRTGVPVNPVREVALPPYSSLLVNTREDPEAIPHRYRVGKTGLM